MPRQQGFTVQNNFVAGLVSDSNLLNFPPNSCVDCNDVIFSEMGKTTRRQGFDFEGGFSTKQIDPTNCAINSYLWTEVNSDGTLNMIVSQVGSKLYFYNCSFPILSQGLLATQVDLTSYQASSATNIASQSCQFSQGLGYLFVVHPQCDPIYVSWDGLTTITATAISVQTRDLLGIFDATAADSRPNVETTSLTTTQKYNLYNQGWYFNGGAYLTSWDTIEETQETSPSNADVWWQYINSSQVLTDALINGVALGNTPAPKGHYLLNVFNEDRSTASGISAIAIVSQDPHRPSCVAFFAGRVWYGGIQAAGYSNRVYFSQILTTINQAGLCFQKNDPTAQDNNSLLESDGGWVTVQGIGTIYSMKALQNSLVLFSSKGIYAISGGASTAFLATDYTVTKISSLICTNNYSVVDVEGSLFFWNDDGIYELAPVRGYSVQTNQYTLPSQQLFTVTSITDFKIHDYIQTIPIDARKNTRGAWNQTTRTIEWLYSMNPASTPDQVTAFTNILVYNTLTKAFYKWTIGSNAIIRSNLVFPSFGGSTTTFNVTKADGTTLVVDSLSDQVITFAITGNTAEPIFKYIVSYVDGSSHTQFTIGQRNNTNYVDWQQLDSVGQNYSSNFLTSYAIPGEGMKFFQPNYLSVFLQEETNAGGQVQGVFDWTSNSASNRWSALQELYNSTTINTVANFRRLKIRGKGKSIQFRVQSDNFKPFTIVGWAVKLIGNADL